MLLRVMQHAIHGAAQPRTRAIAVITTMLIAVASAGLVVAFWLGLRAQARTIVEEWEGNLYIASFTRVRPDPAGRLVEENSLRLEDLRLLKESLPLADVVIPVSEAYMVPVRGGSAELSTTVVATEPAFFQAWGWHFAAGGPFGQADLDQATLRCVLGATVAGALFGDEQAVGKRVSVKGHSLLISGVLARKGPDSHGVDRDNVVVVPFTTGVKRLWTSVGVRAAYIHVGLGEAQRPIADKAAGILRLAHGIGVDKKQDFAILWDSGLTEKYLELNKTKILVGLILVVVATGLAFVVISATVGSVVAARQTEYALKRCVGATKRRVVIEVIGEVMLLWLVATIFGSSLGLVGSRVISHATLLPGARWSTLPMVISPAGIALAMLPTFVASLLGTVGPMRRVATLEPAVALRDQR